MAGSRRVEISFAPFFTTTDHPCMDAQLFTTLVRLTDTGDEGDQIIYL